MDRDVLTGDVEKLKSVYSSKGLIVPKPSEVGLEPGSRDYDLALLDMFGKFEGVYAIAQDIRARKFKHEFSLNWNPFRFESAPGCKPFLVSKIERYGYDASKDACRCPDVYSPCSLNQALNDRSLWSTYISDQMGGKEDVKPLESLKIATLGPELIDIYGNSIDSDNEGPDEVQEELCKQADIVLCSVHGFGPQSTDWSEWSGCSSKCGPGTQERVKINYDGRTYSVVKESRECNLGRCKHRSHNIGAKCLLRKIKESETFEAVNYCRCPNPDEKLCTSEEAEASMRHWTPYFRSFCTAELDKNKNSDLLQEDISDRKLDILGRNTRIAFPDGFFYDCSGNWGVKQVEDLHIYCMAGSPILCKREEADGPIEFSALQLKDKSGVANVLLFFVWACTMYILLTFFYRVFRQRNRP